jgi:hypothetical protein
VRTGVAEAHRAQERLGLGTGVDANLHEREAVERRRRREPVLEHQQRAHRVDRCAARVGQAEDVVEDLERQRARIAGGEDSIDQPADIERALAGKAAVVPAPLQDVHRQIRRVGELQEEDPVAGDGVDRGQVGAAREDVERIQAGPERRVTGGLDDPPRVVVFADVAAPGKRLVRDLQAALAGAGRERVELLGGQVIVVDGVGRDVRADQHGVGAELFHHVELGLGAAQVAVQLGDRFEVAERLIEVDAQAECLRAVADLGGRERRTDQVGLEDLDAVEAGRGGGLELGVERSAQADGGDRAAHQTSTACVSVAKWRSIRSRSGATPVNSSNAPAACMTAMPPPSSVRQPSSRAYVSSSVSSGR